MYKQQRVKVTEQVSYATKNSASSSGFQFASFMLNLIQETLKENV